MREQVIAIGLALLFALAPGSVTRAAESATSSSAGSRSNAGTRWITHVSRGERASATAARYGVSEDDVRAWNPWIDASGRIGRGRVVQIRTDRPATRGPTPLAARRVAPAARTHGRPPGGQHPHALAGWGRSVGSPNDGAVVGAVQLPSSALYDRYSPDTSWGSRHAVEQIVAAVTRFRSASRWTGRLMIGSISKREGGPFEPHRSHQSGRDVDIRLPLRDGSGDRGTGDEVDWRATWQLVEAFLAGEEVDVIFLSAHLLPSLVDAATTGGATPEQLERLGAKVRHWRGHDRHIHVRLSCAGWEAECRGITHDDTALAASSH